MAEIIKRKYVNGELVDESIEEIDWEPNEADLDIVLVRCKECGNEFDMPFDALMYLNDAHSQCGQCRKTGTFEVVADPSPNKRQA
ncbi:MAG: hypothetical protein SWH61_03375 [Thermodesulfobacteriota bacterium]|nr:hypothetical protein [Thermodesulfobacteriota bacterium]